MAYIGRSPVIGSFKKIDDLTSQFNGAQTVFTLLSNGSGVDPGTSQNLLVSLGGVLQEPVTAYTVSGSTITFSSAPANTQSFFAVQLGDALDVGYLTQGVSIDVTNVNAAGIMDVAGDATFSSNVEVLGYLTVGNNTITMNSTTLVLGNTSANMVLHSAGITMNGVSIVTASGASNNALHLEGQTASFYTNASNLSTGTLPLGRLSSANTSANGVVDTTTQTFAGDKTFQNTVTVTGNLTVLGTSVTLNSENVLIKDNIITLNSNVTGAPVLDAGIEVNRGTSANVTLKWNETGDKWQLTNDGTTYETIVLPSMSANTSANGVVDTTTQTFAGLKTFNSNATFSGSYTFFASGSVLDWNSGDVTLTHSANTLTFAGASSGYSFDRVVKTNTGGAATGGFIDILNGAGWDVIGYVNATSSLAIGGYRSSEWNELRFYTSGTQKLNIDSSGNMGIGNAVPTHKLTVDISSTSGVVGSMANAYPVVQFGNQSSDATRRALEIGVVGGSVTAPVYLKVVGTGNRFAIFNQSNTEQFTIDSSGNVGIGTTSPNKAGFTKAVTFESNGQTGFEIVGSKTTDAALGNIVWINAANSYAYMGQVSVRRDGADNSGALTFSTWSAGTGAERMRIDNSGNVGIGVIPTVRLHIEGASNIASRALFTNNLVSRTAGIGGNRDTSDCPWVGSTTNHAFVIVTNDTERMRITSGGDVGIGKTSPSAKLDVLGNIRHSNTSGGYLALTHDLTGYTSGLYATLKTDDTCLYFDVAGVYTGYICNTGGFTDVSDGRLKTNVSTIMNATSAVLQLRGVNYAWKDGRDNFQNHTGFIAQEVQAVIPEVVSDGCAGEDCNGPGILGVQDSALLPWIVEAFKEMYTKFQQQQVEIDTLKAELASLKG